MVGSRRLRFAKERLLSGPKCLLLLLPPQSCCGYTPGANTSRRALRWGCARRWHRPRHGGCGWSPRRAFFARYVDKEGNGCLEHTHQTGNDEVAAIPGRLHGVAHVRIEFLLSLMRGAKSPEFIRARGSFRLDWGRIAGRKRVAFGVKPYESAICVLFPNVKQTKTVYVCFKSVRKRFSSCRAVVVSTVQLPVRLCARRGSRACRGWQMRPCRTKEPR